MTAWDKTAFDTAAILERMKDVAGWRWDKQLAAFFDVSNVTVSSWRTRNSLPLAAIAFFCRAHGADAHSLIFGDQPHGR